MPYTYEKIEEQQGYRLLRRDDGRYCVIAIHHGHVYGAVPEDEPRGGGRWESSDTDVGISYVARGYPERYAREVYRRLVAEAFHCRSLLEQSVRSPRKA
jgi:hypothetical protein